MKKFLKWAIRIGIFLLVAGLSVFVILLNSEKSALQTKYDSLSKKNELLIKKAREEKSKVDALMYKNRTTESQQAALRDEITKREEKYNQLLAEKESVEKEMTSQKKAHAAKTDELKAVYTALENEKKALETEHKNSLKEISRLESANKLEIKEKKMVEARLKRTDIKLGQCEKKNAELCDISTGLLSKIENQSVLGKIMNNENFVQLKRVEVEKLVQEYQDKIDELKLEERPEAGKE